MRKGKPHRGRRSKSTERRGKIKDMTNICRGFECDPPVAMEKTLTYDQGKEMAAHKVFASATDMKVYFADPQSPWQRGTNENTNGLLRQYFSKGTALSGYTQVELNAVAERLNDRPRKTLSFATPKEAFSRLLAELNENLEIKPGVAYAT